MCDKRTNGIAHDVAHAFADTRSDALSVHSTNDITNDHITDDRSVHITNDHITDDLSVHISTVLRSVCITNDLRSVHITNHLSVQITNHHKSNYPPHKFANHDFAHLVTHYRGAYAVAHSNDVQWRDR
jgi:hypothetical protein